MPNRFIWAVGLALAVALSPVRADERKDAYGDPLPEGATARLGTERMRIVVAAGAPVLMPDGKSILSPTPTGLDFIDVTTGLRAEKIKTPVGTRSVVPTLVSADGKRGVASTGDAVVAVELATFKKLCEVKRRFYSTDSMVAISADGKTLAVGALVDDKAKEKGVTATLWNVDDDKEIASCKVAQNNSARVALSADGKVLATWGYHFEQAKPGVEVERDADPARRVQFWDGTDGQELGTAKFLSVPSAVTLAPDGKTAAVADLAGTIKLFDTKSGELRKQLLGRSRLGRLLQFSGDGKALAAVAEDGAVQLWDAASGKMLGVSECPVGGETLTIRGVAFPTAERAVALVTRGVACAVYEAPSGKRLSPAGGHTELLSGVGFAAGDKEVIGAAAGGQVLRWDLTGKELGAIRLRVPGSPTIASGTSYDRLVVAPSGTMAYRSEGSGGLGLYDLPTGLQRCNLPTDGMYGTQLSFSKSGGKLAMLVPGAYSLKPKPGRIVLIDTAKNEVAGGFHLPAGTVSAMALTADGGKLAVVRRVEDAKGTTAKLFLNGFDAATGKPLGEMALGENFRYATVHVVSAQEKDSVLLVDPGEGLVEIDIAEGKKTRIVTKGRLALTIPPVLSGDGKFLAFATGSTYSQDPSTIEIRDLESGEAVHTFKGHSRPVMAMAFSKDGKMLASAAADTTILVWDLTAGKE